MAPPHRGNSNPNSWFEDAYLGRDDIAVQWELEFGKDIIKPGTLIKIKNLRGHFKFRCMAHNIKLDQTWIDCIEVANGQHRSFHLDKIKGVVKPKRSRRRKPNV